MQKAEEGGVSNPHDLSLHKQIKEASHLLKPEVIRLYKNPEEVSEKLALYQTFIEEIKLIKSEISNCDAVCACRNILDHMEKVVVLIGQKSKNKDILSHLQEVMALLFKVQNLPS